VTYEGLKTGHQFALSAYDGWMRLNTHSYRNGGKMKFFRMKGPRLFLLPFALLLIFILLSGCSKGQKKHATPLAGDDWLNDMRGRIEKHIDDPVKKTQLLELVDQDEKVFREMYQETKTFYHDMYTIDKSYNSTQDDFRKLFADYNATRDRLRNQSIENRFKMIALTTPEEWRHLSKISKGEGIFEQLIQYPRK
jgi:hypothetical protein